jgi:hypothetical protein
VDKGVKKEANSEIWDESDVDGYEWIVILVLICGTWINGV